MDNRLMPGIATVSVGVLLVVLSRVLDLGAGWEVALSVAGAVVAVVGAVMVFRAQRSDPDA